MTLNEEDWCRAFSLRLCCSASGNGWMLRKNGAASDWRLMRCCWITTVAVLPVHGGIARARGDKGGLTDGCAMLEAEGPVSPTVTAPRLDASRWRRRSCRLTGRLSSQVYFARRPLTMNRILQITLYFGLWSIVTIQTMNYYVKYWIVTWATTTYKIQVVLIGRAQSRWY